MWSLLQLKFLLNVRDTEMSSFLVAMGDVSLRKTGVEEKRAKAKKESDVLLEYTRKAIQRLTYLKKILAQLEEDVVPCESQMENWKTNLEVMAAKEDQYIQQYKKYEQNLVYSRLLPYFFEQDKALAALAIEDKKRQFAAAEKYLEEVLQSALETNDE
ncbi:hypothetical protein BRARA_D02522 [Brassica rapa]|uniref:Uncharacterized protein n=1 Tax=Brassica campestris TaxID=3711 RepID=A0A397ZPM1_BRACM|nr:hypothetical protein BRARA_D02522 [Brassica rapa]